MPQTLFARLRGIRPGGLPLLQRLSIIGAAMVLALVLAYFDYRNPSLRLVALAVLFVITITAVGGWRVGLPSAIGLAFLFTYAEQPHGAALVGFATTTVTARLTTYLIAVGLVELIRRQDWQLNQAQVAVSEARFRAVGESLPFGVWHCDADGRAIHMSESFLKLVGMSLEEVRTGGWLSRVPKEDAERVREAWRNRERWNDDWEEEYRILGTDNRWYTILCRGRKVRDETGRTVGWTGFNLDVSERSRDRERLGFLAEAGRVLSLSLDPNRTLERLANLTVPRLADWCAIDVLAENGELRPVVVLHSDPAKMALARELRTYAQNPDEPRGSAAVARSGVSELYSDIPDALLQKTAQDEKHLALLRKVGLTSVMIVPLRARERVLGTMTFACAESGRTFTQDDVRLAEMLAARAALAYDNARAYAREHHVADTLQRASLPLSLPQLPGIRIRAAYLPAASESEIGGDWYDAFALQDGMLAISIGDVAGKGLRAAVAMTAARQTMRAAALEGSSPAKVLSRLNRLLVHESSGMITAVFGILDPVTLRFTFASAGHPPPLYAAPGKDVSRLLSSGLPLGLFPDQAYGEKTIELVPGSLLVFHTDGLTEFSRNVIEGEAVVMEAVTGEAQSPTPDPAGSILRRVVLSAHSDDIALLTIGISAAPLDHVDLTVDAAPASARVLRQALRRFALAIGLDESGTDNLLLASGEAISNVIEHAYGVRDGQLHVRAYQQGEEVVVEIKDHGHWREPSKLRTGLGMMLMRTLMTTVDVTTDDAGTVVTMRMSAHGREHDRASQLSTTRR